MNEAVLELNNSVSFGIRRKIFLIMKRCFDVFVSSILLILFSPIFIIVSIMIKLDSKGPVFFKQERSGKNGKIFNMYKFRSMTADNDVHNFAKENQVTQIGRILRRTSLDELPQLINIIKGEMSFIGPRPWITDYANYFNEHQKRRLEVLPGITGLAQASGRNGLSIFDKINLDVCYVDHLSIKMELLVIFKTIKAVLKKEEVEISKSGIKDELDELKKQWK